MIDYRMIKVMELYYTGHSVREVAAQLRIGKSTVGRIVKSVGLSRDKRAAAFLHHGGVRGLVTGLYRRAAEYEQRQQKQ